MSPGVKLLLALSPAAAIVVFIQAFKVPDPTPAPVASPAAASAEIEITAARGAELGAMIRKAGYVCRFDVERLTRLPGSHLGTQARARCPQMGERSLDYTLIFRPSGSVLVVPAP